LQWCQKEITLYQIKTNGKLHATFKEKVYWGIDYLKKIIFADQGDPCRFICQACKDEKKELNICRKNRAKPR